MKKSLVTAIILTAILCVLALSACSSEGIPIVEELTIIGSPITEYRRGSGLDLQGAQLRVRMSDGNEIVVPIDETMITTHNMNDIGTQTVLITYREKRVGFSITILDAPVISIAINTEPAKKNYIEGEELSLNGGYINVNYDIGEPSNIPITADMITGYNRNAIGEQKVVVNYEGHSASYKVNVRARALMEMRVEKNPNRDLYTEDDEINLSGGTLRLIYDNGTTEIADMATLEGLGVDYNLAEAISEKAAVTLSYKGRTTSFTVNVIENEIGSWRLLRAGETLDGLPNQKVNVPLNLDGVSIKLIYRDGDEEIIPLDEPSSNKVNLLGYDLAYIGVQILTLNFYNGLSQELEVNTLEKISQSLEINQPQGVLYQDSVIDLTGWSYTIIYDNGSRLENQPITVDMVEGGQASLESTASAGEKSLTFEVQDIHGFVDTVYTFEITALEIIEYEIKPKTTQIVYLFDDIDLSEIKLNINYNSGRTQEISLSENHISGYDKNRLGEQNVTVRYTNKYGSITTNFLVKVIRKAVSLDIVSEPNKMSYVKGEAFDPTGMQINIEYEDENEPVLISEFGSEWQGIDTIFDYIDFDEVLGGYRPIPLQLIYTNSEMNADSVSIILHINVRNDLESISIAKDSGERDNEGNIILEPVEVDAEGAFVFGTIVEGLRIDTLGYFAILYLENGETLQVELVYESHIIDYDFEDTSLGARSFTIKVGKYGKWASANATIEVVEKSIIGIEIKSGTSFKTEYEAGPSEELDTTGIVVNVLYNNNSLIEKNDSELVFSGFQAGESGEQTITITYLGIYTCTYVVTVAEPKVTQMQWADGLTPTLYITQGQELDFPEELEIRITTQFGEQYTVLLADILDDIEIIEFDKGKAAQQQPKIAYRGVTLVFIVVVGPRELISIEFAPDNFIPDVKEGMDIELSRARLIAYYDNDTTKIVSIRQDYTDYSKANLTPGPRVITITYTHEQVSLTLSITINVLPKKLQSIEIETMPKYYYIEGEPFTLMTAEGNDSRIKVNYDNNTYEYRLLKDAIIGSPTAGFNVDISAFDNGEFSGTNQAQRIVVNLTVGSVTRSCDYTISMNDRLYAQVAFNQNNRYLFYYGDTTLPQYELMGYASYKKGTERTVVLSGSQIRYISYEYIINARDEVEYIIDEETGERIVNGIYDELPIDVGVYGIEISYPGDAIHNAVIDTSKTLEIRKKDIFVYAEDASKIYGEENPEISIKYLNPKDGRADTAFAYGQDGSIFGDTLNIKYQSSSGGVLEEITKKTPVGSYSIILSGLQSNNYQISYAYAGYNVGIFTITRRNVTVAAHEKTEVYGIANILLTYDVYGEGEASGLLEGDTLNGGLMRPSNNNKGEYNITQGDLSNANNPNYNITFLSNTVTITKKPIYVVADNLQRVYGDANPALTVKYYAEPAPIGGGIRNPNAFAYTDSPSSLGSTLNMQTSAKINSPVGTYPILPSGLEWANYEIIFENGNLEVLHRPIQIEAYFDTPEDGIKIYGELDPTVFKYRVNPIPGNSSSGLVEGDSLVGSLSRASSGGGLQNDPVGEYAILKGSLYNSNYSIEDEHFISATFTIVKRDAVISIAPEKLIKVYNGQVPSISSSDYTLSNGYNINFANVSVVFETASRNVGSYPATIVNNDANHNITFEDAEGYVFTITQKEVNIQFKEKIGDDYIDLTQELTFKEDAYQFVGVVHPDDVFASDLIQVELNLYSASEVGIYNIVVVSLDNSNYKLPIDTPSIRVEIKRRELTLYLREAPEDSNEIRVEYTGQEARINKFLAKIEDAEGNVIYDNGNYTGLSFDFNVYVVNPSGSSQAPKNVRFDENDNIIGYEINAILTEPFFSRNNEIKLAKVEVGGAQKDYTYIIEQAYAVISIQSQAGVISKTYDTYEPSITSISAGNAAISINDLDFRFERVEEPGVDYTDWSNADVGDFRVRLAFKPASVNKNYILRLQQEYVYRINKQPAVLRIDNRNLSKTYDGIDAQLLPTHFYFTNYQGNQNNNLASGRLQIQVIWNDNTRKNAGQYIYSVVSSDRNHTITHSFNNQFTVNQRPVTFTNISGTKIYGELDPTITYELTAASLVEGEGLLGNITREVGEKVGSYNFNISQLIALNPNYSFSYMHTWHFRVEHKEINVFIKDIQGGDDISATFGEFTNISDYAKLVLDPAGLAPGDSIEDVGLNAALSSILCQVRVDTNAGLYDITAPEIRFKQDSNYKPAEGTYAQFEVKRAPIYMSFNHNGRFELKYGLSQNDLELSFTGYKFGEGHLDYHPSYAISNGTSVQGSNVNTIFNVTLYHENGGENTNYYFDFSEAYQCELEIIKTPLSIKIVPSGGQTLSAIYGESPDYTFQFNGFVLDEGPGHTNYIEPKFKYEELGAGTYSGSTGVVAEIEDEWTFYKNYDITYLPSNYTVQKRKIFVGVTSLVAAFAKSGSTAYSADWLSLTSEGTPLTPNLGQAYMVVSKGSYERRVYTWNGSSYQELSVAPSYDTMHILSGTALSRFVSNEDESGILPLEGHFSFDVNPILTQAELALYGTEPYGLTGGDSFESLFIDIYSNEYFSYAWRDNETSVRSTELFTSRYIRPVILGYELANYEFVSIEREVVVHTYLESFEIVKDELLIDDQEDGSVIWLRGYRQDGVQMLLNIDALGFDYSTYLRSAEYRSQTLAHITYSEPYIGVGNFKVIGAPQNIPSITLNNQVIRVYATTDSQYSYPLKNQNDVTYTVGSEIKSGNEYLLKDTSNQPINENYDKIHLSARFSKLVEGNKFTLILNSQGNNILTAEISATGMVIKQTGQPDYRLPNTDFLTDGFVHDMLFLLNKRDGGLTICIDELYKFNVDIDVATYRDASLAGFSVSGMSAWIKEYRIYRQGYKTKLGIGVTNAFNESIYITNTQNIANINLNSLFQFSQVKELAAGAAYSILYKVNGVALSEMLIPINHLTGEPTQAYPRTFSPGYYDISCTIYNNFTDYTVLAEYATRIAVKSSMSYFDAKLNGAVNTPDMAATNKAFGHTYAPGQELVATSDTQGSLITLGSGIAEQYNKLSMVFELDRASYNDTYRTIDQRPGGLFGVAGTDNFAIISLKTNDNALNAYTAPTNDEKYIGLALAIGYDSASGKPSTRIYMQANGGSAFKFVSAIRTDIDWLAGKVRIDATFDQDNDVILIKVYTDYLSSNQALTVIRLDTYTSMFNVSSSTNSLISRTIINEIASLTPRNTHPQLANVAFELFESRVTLYRLVAGENKVDPLRHDYVEIKDGEYGYVARNEEIAASQESKTIAFNDGFDGVYLRNYNTYKVDINNLNLGTNGVVEFIIASNDLSTLLPPSSPNRNRTIKLVYSDNKLVFVFEQHGHLSYAQEIDIGNINLADGHKHTIVVNISRESIGFDHPNITGNSPVTANTVNIVVDGREGVTGYFPHNNNNNNWKFQESGLPSITANQKFIGTFTWAGVRITNGSMQRVNIMVGEGNI